MVNGWKATGEGERGRIKGKWEKWGREACEMSGSRSKINRVGV